MEVDIFDLIMASLKWTLSIEIMLIYLYSYFNCHYLISLVYGVNESFRKVLVRIAISSGRTPIWCGPPVSESWS